MSNDYDNISDIMDDALESYPFTDEYKTQRHELNEKIAAFRKNLGPALLPDFDNLINTITDLDGKMAETTFRLGFECRDTFKDEAAS